MDTATFTAIRDLVHRQSGIALRPGKEAMVRARLAKRMRALGIERHREYLDLVLKDRSGQELVHLIDAICTNVTSFYREPDHYVILSELMDTWVRAGQRRFRFWSAACSSGEEPYSMAITLLDAAASHEADIRILATDLSTRMLARAQEGRYTADKIEPVPKHVRQRYFVRCGRGEGAQYEVGQRLRSAVVFRRLNLHDVPYPMRGPLDAVFCRNVMIYFDIQGRIRLLQEIDRLLKPGGYLFVGHAESLTGMLSAFKAVRPSVYVKKGGA